MGRRIPVALLALLLSSTSLTGWGAQAEAVEAPTDPLGLELREENGRTRVSPEELEQIRSALALVPARNESDQKQLVELLNVTAKTALQREVFFESAAAMGRLAGIKDYLNKDYRVVWPLGEDTSARLADYDLKTGSFHLTLPHLPELERATFTLGKPEALQVEKARDGGHLECWADLVLQRAPGSPREVTVTLIDLRLHDGKSGLSWPIPLPGKASAVKSPVLPPRADVPAVREFKLKDGRVVRGQIVMQLGDRIAVKDGSGKVVTLDATDLEDQAEK